MDTQLVFYVYILFDWLGIPRYVGKGKGDRWSHHERRTDPVNRAKNEFIERTWAILGEIPKIKIRDGLAEAQALALEVTLIAAIGRVPAGPLVNLTDGGDGVSRSPSAETRRRIGDAQKGRAAPNKGIPHTEITKEKISATNKGKPGPVFSAETIVLLSQAKLGNKHFLGKRHTEATKEKIRQTKLGKPRPTHVISALLASHIGRPLPAEWRANIGRGSIGRKHDEATLETMRRWIWITNGISSQRIDQDAPIRDGWYRGRPYSPRIKCAGADDMNGASGASVILEQQSQEHLE